MTQVCCIHIPGDVREYRLRASGIIGKDRFNQDMILYRPVGLKELELMYDSGMQSFPARLPKQPIFYPVLDLEYARQIRANAALKHRK